MKRNEEFEKWAEENRHPQYDWPVLRKGYNARQPEIDALKEETALCLGTLESRERNISTLMEENAALKAEVKHLKEALRPFAAYADHYPTDKKYGNRPTKGEWHSVASGDMGMVQIDVEDFHRAKAAIKEKP